MSTICPKCKRDDAIQKVSAVVTSGQASGTFSGPTVGYAHIGKEGGLVGGHATLSGTSVTVLASKLASPKKPEKESFGCALLLSFIVGVIGPIAGITLLTSGDLPVGARAFGSIFLLGGISGLFVVFAYFATRTRREAKHLEKVVAWNAAMTRWNRLYYCYRDDIVFDPETGETCQPEAIQQFVYQGATSQVLSSGEAMLMQAIRPYYPFANPSWLKIGSIRRVRDYLAPGEIPEGVIFAQHPKTGLGGGGLWATNRRLLYVGTTFWGKPVVEEYPYDKISAIESSADGSVISIHCAGKKVALKGVDKRALLVSFLSLVRKKMGNR